MASSFAVPRILESDLPKKGTDVNLAQFTLQFYSTVAVTCIVVNYRSRELFAQISNKQSISANPPDISIYFDRNVVVELRA